MYNYKKNKENDNIFVQTEIAEASEVRLAKSHGNGARVSVPKSWIGRHVQVTLLYDPLKEEDKKENK